jgi:3-oxoacyl-[acyl-carrier-protein] synthase-1
MFRLLCRAVRECLDALPISTRALTKAPALLLAIDDMSRPDYEDDLPDLLFMHIRENLDIDVSPFSRIFAQGSPGFFRALQEAQILIATSKLPGCIVAGVDSLLNGPALEWLESERRLKTGENSDGVIPGEAAAALWLESKTDGDDSPQILGIGFGEDRFPVRQGEPVLATGLAEAIRAALAAAGLPLEAIDIRVGGATGERLAFIEASVALGRIQRVHKDSFPLWLPAEKLGDVGAALPACMAVYTAVAMVKGYASGRNALLFSSSSISTHRAACVMTMPTHE